MTKKVVRGPRVRSDLRRIAEYIIADSKSHASARRVLGAINETFRAIVDRPRAYVVVQPPKGGEPLSYQVRMRPVRKYNKYLVFYTAQTDETDVKILRVIHSAQDWVHVLFEDEALADADD